MRAVPAVNDRLVAMAEVELILGLKKTKVYEMVKAGELCKPKKFGRSSRWPLSRVLACAGLVQDNEIEDLL